MANGTWSFNDAVNGFCSADDIGKPRHPNWEPPLEEDKPTPTPGPVHQPMTRAERKVKLQQVADGIIHYAAAHPEAMLDDNGAQVNKLLDLFAKMDEREEEKPTLGKLTDNDLANMSITDLKRVLIDVVLEHVPADRREAWVQTLLR